MRRASLAAAVATLIAACGLPSAQIVGTVTAAPGCPTSECPAIPAPGIHVELTGTNGSFHATTDSSGHFSTIVPAGSYGVALIGTLPNNTYVSGTFADFSGPKRISVGVASRITVHFVLDSEIR